MQQGGSGEYDDTAEGGDCAYPGEVSANDPSYATKPFINEKGEDQGAAAIRAVSGGSYRSCRLQW